MKVILIDDEKLALNYLESQLKKIDGIQMIAKFLDPLKGKERILQEDVDLVFLDINMPEINGIELAEQIIASKPSVHIVFVTAYHDYAIKAFELNALDYILKPISHNRLIKTVQRIQERHGKANRTIVPTTDTIKLNMFQQVEICSDNHHFGPLRWRTSKAQELFIYLLQHRGQFVRKSTLIDLLWPEFNPERAFSQLYTAIYHIRKTLQSIRTHFVISSESDGYILHLEDVLVDVEEWEKFFNSNPSLSEKTIAEWESVMKYYTGNYLQDFEYIWVESERQRLKQLWLRYSYQMAEWYLSNDQHDKAIEKYDEICYRHSSAEEAHFALMKIYAKKKNVPKVHEQYRKLTIELREQLNVRPSPYITEWFEKWLQEKKK